jgi:hypothetical protein
MKSSLSIFLFLIFISAAAASSASERNVYAPQANNCQQPFSDRFDEFTFTGIADAEPRLRKLEAALNESKEAQGIVHVYGGKKSRVNEITEIMAELRKVLRLGASNYNSKLYISDAGYRSLPTVELFIKPLNCSQYPATVSDLEIEEIEFVEAPAASTLRKSPEEIGGSLVQKTEPVCPPAARAVRACDGKVEVYVVINQKGEVIFARAVSGHPLLRQAGAASVKNWKFQPAKIKDKAFNVNGYITVEFQQPDETIG